MVSKHTKEEILAMKARHIVGKRVVIKKVVDPAIPQYEFTIGKKGKIESVSPDKYGAINVRLENGMLLGFHEDEVELLDS